MDESPEQQQPVPEEPTRPDFVEATCEECGQTSTFAGALIGSVVECPHCWKFMDVAMPGADLDWGDPDEDAADVEESE